MISEVESAAIDAAHAYSGDLHNGPRDQFEAAIELGLSDWEIEKAWRNRNRSSNYTGARDHRR